MTVDSFLDTNVLVYAYGSTLEERRKQTVAIELVNSVEFGISAQVLQEFYATVTRKVRIPMLPEHAYAYVDQFMEFPVVAIDEGIVTEGIRNSLEYQISYWDGAIIAAAERMECKVLYTEDLNDGQQYGTVTVRNPFAGNES